MGNWPMGLGHLVAILVLKPSWEEKLNEDGTKMAVR